MTLDEQVEHLWNLLAGEDLPPARALAELKDVGEEARDELVRRVARTFAPPPPGRLLARLPMLRTEQNRDDMIAAFLANLGAPDPGARKASLYGLERQGYPAIADVAMLALRDPTDLVLAAACDILLRLSPDAERVGALMRGVHEQHGGDARFYSTLAVLHAHGIGEGPPDAPDGGAEPPEPGPPA